MLLLLHVSQSIFGSFNIPSQTCYELLLFPKNEKGILPQQVTLGDLIALQFMVDPFLKQNQHSTRQCGPAHLIVEGNSSAFLLGQLGLLSY